LHSAAISVVTEFYSEKVVEILQKIYRPIIMIWLVKVYLYWRLQYCALICTVAESVWFYSNAID